MTTAQSLFTDDSMVRRVHREQMVALGGPRALLMQASHPVAFAGFFAHTGALDEPYERLNRTARVMDTITFGPRRKAEAMTRHVRAMHRRVRGELAEPAGRFPAGTPYAADDPGLLLWVLATLADSSLVAYERYVRPLGRDERDAYWRDYREIGRLFALRDADMPQDVEELGLYMADIVEGDTLFVTPEARRLAVRIVMRPPVPLQLRPVVELSNFVTVGLLPPRVRRLYGFSWDPARAVALRTGAEYTRRVVVPLLPERMRLVPSARRGAA
jgi:uncharacterized protein (DUF2236 family)